MTKSKREMKEFRKEYMELVNCPGFMKIYNNDNKRNNKLKTKKHEHKSTS
tara:strand:- start:104 stop:253 length:150 start_codon:yes stop_codon:yes gene_type:complete